MWTASQDVANSMGNGVQEIELSDGTVGNWKYALAYATYHLMAVIVQIPAQRPPCSRSSSSES